MSILDRSDRQELLNLLWATTDDLIYLTTEDGRLLHANPAFFEVLGYDWSDYADPDQRWAHIHPEDRHELAEHLQSFLHSDRKTSDRLRNRFVQPSGNVLWVEHTISKVEWHGERHLLFISRDISERRQVVDALRESEGRFRAVFEEAGIGIALVRTDGSVLDTNPALRTMLGYTAEELQGIHFAEITHPDDRETDLTEFNQLIEGERRSYRIQKRYLCRDGNVVWGQLTVSMVRDASGTPQYALGMVEDVTERRRTEAALQASEQRFRELFENSPDAVFVESYDGTILDVNPAACELHGMSREELIGKNVMDTIPPEHRDQAKSDFKQLVDKSHSEFEGYSWTKDGHAVPVEMRTNHIEYQGEPALLFHVRDITERKRFEARLAYLADHDHLTGLHNRRRFEGELQAELTRSIQDESYGALLWIDVDRFKAINDRLGYKAGDEMLVNLAHILTDDLRSGDKVARVGGDEFAVLVSDADRDQAEAIAEKLLEMSRSLRTARDEEPIRLTVSIGIARFPDDGQTETELVTCVERATRQAKEEGGNRCHVYAGNPEGDARRGDDLNWAERIREALEEDRFRLYRQSVWDLAQDRSHGAELLLRMEGDEREILPGAFLEAATRFGLMLDIDRWVIGEAVRLLADDQRNGHWTCFEVNLSAKAIGDADLIDYIEDFLHTYDIDPSYLTLEITETDAISNVSQAAEFIRRLKALGCKFALDDFGVGFSTFYHLKHLPVDYLKIDGDFVRDLANEPLDQHIVRSIVHIAQAMGIQTIAEYVEDEATFRMLTELEVDYAQGFVIDRPSPVSVVAMDTQRDASD